jgi:hypothetical protein
MHPPEYTRLVEPLHDILQRRLAGLNKRNKRNAARVQLTSCLNPLPGTGWHQATKSVRVLTSINHPSEAINAAMACAAVGFTNVIAR